MNAIEKLESRINEILSSRVADLQALDDAVQADRQAEAKAAQEMEEATKKNDLEEYRRAKGARALANDAAELHAARRAQLVSKPLITDEEYTSLRDAVLEEMQAGDEKATREAAAVLKRFEDLAKDNEDRLQKGNALLMRLFTQILKHPDADSYAYHPDVLQIKAPHYFSTGLSDLYSALIKDPHHNDVLSAARK